MTCASMNNGTVKFGAKSMGNRNTIDASGLLLKMCNGEGTEKNIETPGPKPQLLKEFKACGDPGGRRWRP